MLISMFLFIFSKIKMHCPANRIFCWAQMITLFGIGSILISSKTICPWHISLMAERAVFLMVYIWTPLDYLFWTISTCSPFHWRAVRLVQYSLACFTLLMKKCKVTRQARTFITSYSIWKTFYLLAKLTPSSLSLRPCLPVWSLCWQDW